MKAKKWFSVLLAVLLVISTVPNAFKPKIVQAASNTNSINLVDSNASKNTKLLFNYLKNVGPKKILFGQQHATDEGLTLKGSGQRAGSKESEIKNSVGDYPAIFGWDTLSLDGYEKPGVSGDSEKSIKNLAQSMKAAHELGGIVTLSMHPYNFVTSGNFNDTTGNVVEHILPGGEKNSAFNKWLDNIAALAKELSKDDIPLIFRPFHEQTGNWFWWGANTTTSDQYKAIFRYTVEYLRDVKDVHNILYAYSPGAGPGGDKERYLETYPGDEYVDIFGIDKYDNKQNAGSESFFNDLIKDLEMLVDLADEKGKIAALTEFGYSPEGLKKTGNHLTWFTDLLNAIKKSEKASRISYMLTWANFGWPNNIFVPYKDINGDLGGDHELLPDFINFYNDRSTAFSSEIKEKRYSGEVPTTVEKQPFMHVASPASGTTIRENTVTIRARVLNDVPKKVTYAEKGSTTEHEMKYDEQSRYYKAEWSPSGDVNGSSTELTIKSVMSDGTVQVETVKVFVKVPEIILKEYRFDDDINDFKNNGAWPDSIKTDISHAVIHDNGMLKISSENLQSNEDWQELKLELTDTLNFSLHTINRVTFDAYVPTSLNSGNASLRSVVMFPDDWETKHGIATTERKLSDLETETFDGVEYAKYPVSIDITGVKHNPKTLAISIVGSALAGNGDIYIDNIKLINLFKEASLDPSVIDDFENYLGDNDLLKKNYTSNGDGVTVSLSTENKNDGEYGLKYDYKLASQGYTGANKTLGGVDWSEYNQLKFWIKPDGKSQRLNIQLTIDGVGYEAYRYYDNEEPRMETINFAEFKPASWADQSLILTKEKLKNVSTFSIYVDAVDKAKLENTLYFDDIKVFKDKEAPDIPENGDGQVRKPEKPGILYDFENDVEDFDVTQNHSEATKPKVTDEFATSGKHSLVTEFNLSKSGGFELSKITDLNLASIDAISANVKLSSGSADVKLYIKTGNDWAWADSGTYHVGTDEFTKVIFPLKGINQAQLEQVKAIGLQVLPKNGEGKAKLYLDEVTLEGKAIEEPTRKPLLFDFEDGTNNWKIGYSENEPTEVTTTSENAINGSSLTTTFNLSKGKFSLQTSEIKDLTGENALYAKVKISKGKANVKLYMQTGSAWNWVDSGEVSIEENQVVTLKLPLTDIKELKSIQAIGIEILPIEGVGNANVYVDDVSLIELSDEPDTDKPGTNEPGVEQPDTDKPDGENPDKEAPDTDKPDGENPDVDKPDTDKPDSEKPDTDKPDMDKPDTDKSSSNTSDTIHSDSNQTDVNKSGSNQNAQSATGGTSPLDKNNNKQIDHKHNAKSTEKLPKTATNHYELFFTGLLLLIVGITIPIMMKKRKNKEV